MNYKILAFSIDNNKYALHLKNVERVSLAAEITVLPGSPSLIQGILNVGGNVYPVIDIRKKLNLPAKQTDLFDKLVFVRTNSYKLAFLADSIDGYAEITDGIIASEKELWPSLGFVDEVLELEGNLILIHNVEKFFTIEEAKALRDFLDQPSLSFTTA